MTVVGMLHHRKNPENVKKAYAFAAVALMEGIDFFYFSYKDVCFESEKIKGWKYESGGWVRGEKGFPDVVINSSSPKTKAQSKIGKRLRKMTIFTSNPVGHKMKVYRKILKGEKFSSYLIPSTAVKNGGEVTAFLEKYPKAVLKPYKGNQGKKVLIIEKQEEFHVKEGDLENQYTEEEFISMVEELLLQRKWLLQPFIKCETKAGLTYDFRLHMQKNGDGNWEITLIYPRISGDRKEISNVSSGGYRGELIPFLLSEYPDSWMLVLEKLEQFALEFTTHFEGLYKHSFDELGIDVGMDQVGKLWLFEVNWRPGSKHREFEVAKRLIPYCRFLARQMG